MYCIHNLANITVFEDDFLQLTFALTSRGQSLNKKKLVYTYDFFIMSKICRKTSIQMRKV